MIDTFKIDGIPIKYGDAEFTFYNIKHLELYEKPEPNAALHAHAYYELHFFTRGEYVFQSSDKKVKVHAGEFIIMPPQFKHYSVVVSDMYESIVMQFQLEKKNGKRGLYDYFEKSLQDNTFTALSGSNELIKDIKQFQNASNISGIEAICLRKAKLTDIIYQMFSLINGFSIDGEKNLINEDKSDILILIDHMVTSRKYTLNDIAQKTGYSTRNISRLISSIYKMPLSEMKRKYAIETAKELLESDTEYSIEDIASLSGFKNTSAMRNAFRKYEGTTPSLYKAKLAPKGD